MIQKRFIPALALAALASLPLAARADLMKQGATYNRDILVTDTTGANVNSLASGAFTVTQSQAGGAATTITPTITFKASGHYNVAYTAAMTATLGSSALVITATGAVQTDVGDQVVAYDPNDAVLLGLSGVATAASLATANAALVSHTASLATINTQATGANTQATTLLLSLATYQSVLTAGSTASVLNTALVGTADLTGSKVVFTTGINKGVTRTITSMNSGTGAITLLTATPSTPGATDAFSVVQGSKALEQFLAALGTDSRTVLSANAQPNIGITNALPAIDGTGRVTLVPGQSTTASNFTAAPTTGQIASAILLTPANLLATNASNQVTTSNPAASGSTVTEATIWGYATRALTDKAGFTATASNFVAAPTPAQNAAAITFPSTVALSAPDETKIASIGTDTAGTTTLRSLVNAGGTAFTAPALALAPTGGSAPTVSQIAAGILRTPANLLTTDSVGWVAVNNFPSTVVASNLPTDYQQRAVAVTLPTTAPTGYGAGAGGGTAQSGDLYALLNPLVSAGKFTAPALSLAPATALPADFLSTAEQSSLTAAATGTPSAIVAAMKADTLLAKVFNRAKQAYTYNLTTHVITLLNDDGTTMGTVTLTIDPTTNTITGKQ